MGFDHTIMKWLQWLGGADGSTWQKFVDGFFVVSTFMCEEMFLLLIVFIVYWSVNKKLGEYLVFSLFATIGLNGLVKVIVARPRPFLNSDFSDLRYVQVDNFFVNTTHLHTSYSFPSGHSQLAGSLFGSAALFIRKRWVSITMSVLILLVMISRVYLGVHYPSDVLIGGVIGVGIAFVMYYLMNKYPDKKMIILISLFAILVVTLIIEVIKDAVSIGGTVKMVGLAAGVILGYGIETKKINFTVDGLWWKKVLRVVIGFVLVMGIRLGLGALFDLIIGDSVNLEYIFDGIRYICMGIVATALWPYIFTRLKI